MANYFEQMRKIWDAYEAAGNPTPASTHEVAEWAVRNGSWQPRPADIIGQCAADLAHALRQEYFIDTKGRKVRAMHAACVKRQGEQLMLWADIRSAPRQHMDLAFKQRRQQVVSDCRQLKIDVDSYNDNHPDEKPIQMIFDFTRDLQELEQDVA
ncbi:MAG: hypothetical protein V3T19_09750 [Acidiferrobacterales bacterium]